MQLRRTVYALGAATFAAGISVLGAWWAAQAIEARSGAAVNSRLLSEGITWASVETDGLQVRLTGTAPNEAARFRVVNLAGSVVQSARVRDELEVTPVRAIEAPRFSVEMLRNDDGISLIGLVPTHAEGPALAEDVASLAGDGALSDMLETADYPAPEGWDRALAFGLEALRMLPRSKISVAADRVSVTAISESAEQKRQFEEDLGRRTPRGLIVALEISAPRPVLTPFTLRFVRDPAGARFDACSADTERALRRIIEAGTAAGVEPGATCTIGLGVPTPRWGDAAEAGIRAVAALGAGTITFSDADVTLLAGQETDQALFDRVVGDLQAQLPPVFSLNATLPPKAVAVVQGPAEFTARLDGDGQVQLRGRLSDELQRAAVDSFARARFGADKIYTATRFDPDLPDGWPVRVLAGLESLALLHNGELLVRADLVEVTGTTGKPDGRARISQILSDQLGQGQTFRVSVVYDEKFDPLAALPTPQECSVRIDAVLAARKIVFAPGSAEIDGDARGIVDALAGVIGNCPALQMEIAGHTDSQGSEGGNQALSQARAEAVLTALQGRRLDVSGFVAKGYGEALPIAQNDNEEGREANRRIEFNLLSGAEEATLEGPREPVGGVAADDPPAADPAPAPADAAPPAQDGVAQSTPDPINETTQGNRLALEEEFTFEPTDETFLRPRRRP